MRRFLTTTCTTIALVLATVGLPLVAAADLRFESATTWGVDLAEGMLHVESEITITNLTPNEERGLQIIRYYYDRIAIYVPETVANFRAFRDDTLLEHSFEQVDDPEAGSLLEVTISLGRRLFYKSSMELLIEYDIPGDPPRTESLFRVNPAYISFGAYGWGDPGLATVRVEVPGHFDLEVGGAELVETESVGSLVVYTVTGIEDPESFFLYVVGRNDSELSITKASIDGAEVIVRGWPGDDEWAGSVLGYVETGLPVLSDLIGQEWVPDTFVQILESGDVTHSGYGGWYLQESETVEVSEWADPHLVLHELSHTWFNDDLFVGRWITEGLADEFALQAVEGAGLGDTHSLRPGVAPRVNREVGPLNEWESLFGKPVSELPDDVEGYETYGYEASFWVISQLVDEIGIQAMSSVIAAASDDLIAYRGDREAEKVSPQDDWRRFLDLLEEVGGSTIATDLFQQWVTDVDLSERREARDAYYELRDDGFGWSPPLYVRTAMADWAFDDLGPRIREARDVLYTKSVLATNYTTLGLEMPGSLEEAYETATTSMTKPRDLAEHHLDATRRVIEARDEAAEDRGLVDDVGLLGEDITAEVADAVSALADEDLDEAINEASELLALLDNAQEEGIRRLGFGAAGLLVLVSGGVLVSRRRRGVTGSPSE